MKNEIAKEVNIGHFKFLIVITFSRSINVSKIASDTEKQLNQRTSFFGRILPRLPFLFTKRKRKFKEFCFVTLLKCAEQALESIEPALAENYVVIPDKKMRVMIYILIVDPKVNLS